MKKKTFLLAGMCTIIMAAVCYYFFKEKEKTLESYEDEEDFDYFEDPDIAKEEF